MTGGTPTAQMARPRLPLLAVLLAAVASLELTARFSDSRTIQEAAWLAMGAVLALSVRRLGLRELYLIGASAVLSAIVALSQPDPTGILAGALDQATFLMAFILLLGLLQATAATSPSVEIMGEYLTRQPPGRRYYALNGGTAFLAILFNVSVISFLVPLIQQGIRRAAPGDALNPVREQRQISALLRGFAWSVTWSPTAFAPLIVAELLPGVERSQWIGYGFGLFVILMILGALEDRLKFRAYRPQGIRKLMVFPRGAALRFAATTLWFLGLVVLFVRLFDETAVFGVLAACPVMVVGWLAAQNGFPERAGLAALAPRLREIVAVELPGSANVAITLACSGYIGRAAAGLVPAAAVAETLGLEAMPDWVLLAAIPPFLCVVSLLALSPTMMAVFMGSFFAELPVLPGDPTLIAFSISCGWALSMTFSPFATVVLIVSRASGIAPRTLTWGWSLGFTLMAALILVPLFYLLTGGT
ncbi:hypothetical protein [Ovoidimarina sediminis]|uniref:hypothetical protein n=1 Tax=Ovoidimarina sediminis TaxID=3079856 RepID=UPI00290923E5|nr:hypothetical protein [Rhodophyticola sp. MJ-SS7]MDU8943197.1 hypothetical protein [Rhodophyticola sp. MJ-SS7]